jgi:hypothetical protein
VLVRYLTDQGLQAEPFTPSATTRLKAAAALVTPAARNVARCKPHEALRAFVHRAGQHHLDNAKVETFSALLRWPIQPAGGVLLSG